MAKKDYAVAAGHDLTADAAAEVLAAGGNAVDAVIAGALCAMVAEPVLASLLGGGFLMVRPPNRRAECLDFFVQTPRKAAREADLDLRDVQADFGDARQTFHIGAATVATPGVAVGLAEAHERIGRMPFRELAAEAVRHAGAGVALTPFQLRLEEIVAPILDATPEMAKLRRPDGEALKPGEIRANPALADVLETYAREGARFCTEGEVAAATLAIAGTEAGGHLTPDDLRRWRAIWRQPLSATRHGVEIALTPPPAAGGALIAFALALLPRGADAEALSAIFSAITPARLDADLADDPATGAKALLSDETLARWRKVIAGRPRSYRGTTHISAVDGAGLGAALTLSNGEGCGLVAPGTGMSPNNMLGELDLLPDGPTVFAPDQRLSSMMSPAAMVWPDGTLAMLGSGGSNRIRTAMARVIARLGDGPARLEEAILAPRIHVEGLREIAVDFEDRLAEPERAALLARWPEARAWGADSMFFGGVHAVRRDPRGGVEAMGDPRRAGAARTGRAPG